MLELLLRRIQPIQRLQVQVQILQPTTRMSRRIILQKLTISDDGIKSKTNGIPHELVIFQLRFSECMRLLME